MTPALELVHRGTSLAVVCKVTKFTIVHHAGNQCTHVICRDAIANVLAIAVGLATSSDRCIMLVDTSAGEGLRAGFEIAIPNKIACRVVGTVAIVIMQELALVAIISCG